MIRLSWGRYTLIDDVVYERRGSPTGEKRSWNLRAVVPDATPPRREVAEGTVAFTVIRPSATYRGARLDDLTFYADDTVGFTLWTDSHGVFTSWPDGVLLEYTGGQKTGDNYWEGRIALSELEDIQDGLPDEWRPFLPDGTAAFGTDYDHA